MNDFNQDRYLKNKSIAEYGRIRSGALTMGTTLMLISDLLGVAIMMLILLLDMSVPGANLLGVFAFAAISGAILYFVIKQYIQNISYRFVSIEREKMETIAKLAKRFYIPIFLSIACNMVLVLLGVVIAVGRMLEIRGF